MTGQAAPSGQAFEIRRTFDASREVVWKAWTEPARFARWFGPKGFALDVLRMEVRPGGVCHYGMTPPHGEAMWGRFTYREITPPERLVFVLSFADEAGETVRAPFNAHWPLRVLTTVTLAAEGDRTTVTVRSEPLEATAEERAAFASMFDSMRGGWTGTFEQLAGYLAGS